MGVQRQPADLDGHLGLRRPVARRRRSPRRRRAPRRARRRRQAPSARNVAAATARASRVGATSWTRKTLAPRSSASTLVGHRRRDALVRVSRPVSAPEERLARGRRRRPGSRASRSRPGGAAARGCARASCRSRCRGRRWMRSSRDALGDRERGALLQEGADVVDDVVVARVVLHRARLAQHVHEAAVAAASATRPASSGSCAEGGDVVDERWRPRRARPRPPRAWSCRR